MSKKQQSCSFCGRPENQVNVLLAGFSAHICDDCIHQAKQIIGEDQVHKTNNHVKEDLKIYKH